MKIYVGVGRVKEKQWGKELQISLTENNLDELKAVVKDGWVTMTVKKRKEPKGDMSHYCEVWIPDEEVPPENPPQAGSDDNLTF